MSTTTYAVSPAQVYAGEPCRDCGAPFDECAQRDHTGDGPCCTPCAYLPAHNVRLVYTTARETAPAAFDNPWFARCSRVLLDVFSERKRQVARYGTNDDIEDGTGPETRWAAPVSTKSARELERVFREDYEDYEEEAGNPTWVHLVREELAEAFAEPAGSERLEEELIQVAALCVSWVERLRARREA